MIKKEDEVGGFPAIAGGTHYTDRDHDGMPDGWETARSLDPNVADNNGDDAQQIGNKKWIAAVDAFGHY